MNILHMMVGLPRSGKSTLARELGYPIVEPDAIRVALHGTLWRVEAEPMVWAIAHIMVRSLFNAGHKDVILDAVNHTIERRKQWESKDWVLKFHEVNTPASICIERAIADDREYLVPVIERMVKNWEPLGGPTDC